MPAAALPPLGYVVPSSKTLHLSYNFSIVSALSRPCSVHRASSHGECFAAMLPYSLCKQQALAGKVSCLADMILPSTSCAIRFIEVIPFVTQMVYALLGVGG